jgi:two-component sensor histidine kinase
MTINLQNFESPPGLAFRFRSFAHRFFHRPFPLQTRLALLVGGTMLPLVILSAALVYQNYQASRNAAAARVMQATLGTLAAVDRELHDLLGNLQVLSLSPALRNRDFTAFRAEAQRFLSLFPTGHDITVSEASGQIVLNTGSREGEALPVRNTKKTVDAIFKDRKPVISPMFIGILKKRPLFTIDVPVIENGIVIFDLAFDPPMSVFANIVAQQQLPEDWTISVLDREHQQIARRPALSAYQINRASPTLAAKLESNDQGITETISLEGTPLLTAFARSADTGWAVAMGIPSETLTAPAQRSMMAAIGAGILFIGFGLFFSSRMAGQIARAEAHRDLLVNELDHRVRNTLSTVQSIVARTLQGAGTDAAAKKAIEGRLIALARAHGLLGMTNWQGAQVGDVATAILEPFGCGEVGRVRLHGPATALRPQAAIALTMVLNELATNAAKYGSLSVPSGQVTVEWWHSGASGEPQFHQRWQEIGGPPAKPGDRKGFGSLLIERIVTHELQGKVALEFQRSGVTCTIEMPLREIAVSIHAGG